ncbi:hypothetical protein LZ32DRAFT_68738 [Colletotrichum eremochloae]|nr:hypothetical protein LZ32DRAFT_68738 [Colletotrichum eremochloae]
MCVCGQARQTIPRTALRYGQQTFPLTRRWTRTAVTHGTERLVSRRLRVESLDREVAVPGDAHTVDEFRSRAMADLLVHVFYSSIQCALSMGESEHEVHIHTPSLSSPELNGKNRSCVTLLALSIVASGSHRKGTWTRRNLFRCAMSYDDGPNEQTPAFGGVGILPSSSGGPRTRESEQRNGIRWVGDAGTGHYAHTHTDAGVSKKSSPSHPSTHSGS